MLGGLTVPLSWGVAVPPDDYDHWAPDPEEGDDADAKAADVQYSDATDGVDEWAEWSEWEAQAQEAEPRFDVPRTSSVVPRSPSAG